MKKLFIIITLFWSQINTAQTTVGTQFTYQGELLMNNAPVNGSYNFIVNLYDTQSGGVQQMGQNIPDVTVTNGIFSIEVDLGNMVFAGDERWLELSFTDLAGNNLVTLQPRQRVTNAPYAIHAQFVGTNGVNSFAIQDASITTAKIANGAVTSAKLAGDSVTSAKIANGTIATADIASQAVTRTQIAANTIQRSEVDSTQIQERVTGTCAAGSSIRVIAQDGTVTCETDDVGGGSSGWGLTGNAGTTAGTNFIGTTDNQPLEFKVNNLTSMKIIPSTNSQTNLIIGNPSNTISSIVEGSSILGGGETGFGNIITESTSVISGGSNNKIGNADTNPNDGSGSTISGGTNNDIISTVFLNSQSSTIAGGNANKIFSNDSTISGGHNNQVRANYGTVPGGQGNIAGGKYSFAAGKNANIRTAAVVGDADGDENSFVWSQTGVNTTGPSQVLFEALGGFGIGTNAPASPLHIKGQGTTFGSAVDEVVATIEPKVNTDNVSLAINKLDNTKESALLFSTNKTPNFDIRLLTGGTSIAFNGYDSGTQTTMMRIYDKSVDRIDMNTNIEPFTNSIYNLGRDTYRWSTIFTTNVDTTNAVNVTSDRRLKDNIKGMDYGLAEILSMNPVTYSMKSDAEKHTHMGLIAQEVETIIPEIVNQKEDKMHTRSMRYGELIPVLIKATQEQQSLIEQQQTSIQQQSKQIAELKAMLVEMINNKDTSQ